MNDLPVSNGIPADPSDLRAVAVAVAREAAKFVRRRRLELFGHEAGSDESESVSTKSSHTDPVTVADTESEELIRERLRQLRPDDGFLGEESGAQYCRNSDAGKGGSVEWVVDPIDGTVNFVYGIPAYAVSVAARVDGVSVAGAVVDVASGDVYSAARGLGATVTDVSGVTSELRCSDITDPSRALVATGFGYSATRRAAQAALLVELLPRVRDIRRMGAAALDLCMVASGRVDVHYEHGLNPWDWAAGALIAAEAGAMVRVPAGFGEDGEITVAVASGIAESFLTLVKELGVDHPVP